MELSWRGRGENALLDRRAELRGVAKSRIAAIEPTAITKIKMDCHEAHARIIAHGLTSAAAIEFFDALPTVEVRMPPLDMPSIEKLLQNRKAAVGEYGRIERDYGVE